MSVTGRGSSPFERPIQMSIARQSWDDLQEAIAISLLMKIASSHKTGHDKKHLIETLNNKLGEFIKSSGNIKILDVLRCKRNVNDLDEKTKSRYLRLMAGIIRSKRIVGTKRKYKWIKA